MVYLALRFLRFSCSGLPLRYGKIWYGAARYGTHNRMVQYGEIQLYCSIKYGTRYGTVRYGAVSHGEARIGTVR